MKNTCNNKTEVDEEKHNLKQVEKWCSHGLIVQIKFSSNTTKHQLILGRKQDTKIYYNRNKNNVFYKTKIILLLLYTNI
jgi:hypothetical protein